MRHHSLYIFFFTYPGDHRDLHSFPTRRSSDLNSTMRTCRNGMRSEERGGRCSLSPSTPGQGSASHAKPSPGRSPSRSEEHTSELQSRPHLVCRLLLEKKKISIPL